MNIRDSNLSKKTYRVKSSSITSCGLISIIRLNQIQFLLEKINQYLRPIISKTIYLCKNIIFIKNFFLVLLMLSVNDDFMKLSMSNFPFPFSIHQCIPYVPSLLNSLIFEVFFSLEFYEDKMFVLIEF